VGRAVAAHGAPTATGAAVTAHGDPQRTECGGGVDGGGDALLRRHVGLHEPGALAELVSQPLAALPVEIADGDAGSGFGEPADARLTEATGTAGDLADAPATCMLLAPPTACVGRSSSHIVRSVPRRSDHGRPTRYHPSMAGVDELEQRVRVPKTAELVASALRRRIIRRELVEGDALPPEAELMERFGVSRPTLREAFRVLESESLITVRRGSRGGARVHAPDIRVAARYAGLLLQARGTTLDDVFAARVIVEPAAARLIAERRDHDARSALRAALAAEEAVVDDAMRFALASSRFHETLLEHAGNATIAVLTGMLYEIFETATSTVVATAAAAQDQPAENRRAVRAHRKLLAFVEANDASAAEDYWRKHMDIVRQRYRRVYGTKTVVELLQ